MIMKKLLVFTAFIAGFSFITVDGNCNDNLRRTKSFTQYTSRPHIDPKQKLHRSESMPNLHPNYNIDDNSEDDDLSFFNFDTYSSKWLDKLDKDNLTQNNMRPTNNILLNKFTKSEDYSSSSDKYSSDSNNNVIGKKRHRDNRYNNYDLEQSDSDFISYIDYPSTPSSEISDNSDEKKEDYYYPEDFDN